MRALPDHLSLLLSSGLTPLRTATSRSSQRGMSGRSAPILEPWSINPEVERRRHLRRAEADVRAVLVAWDPIPDSPDDEYDCLVWPSIKRLDAGWQAADLAAWLSAVLREHFGVSCGPEETGHVAHQLLHVWASRT